MGYVAVWEEYPTYVHSFVILDYAGRISPRKFYQYKRGELEMLRTIMIPCTMVLAMGMAHADPLKLTDTQMDMVTAGVGANNVAVAPWDALKNNHSLNHNNNSDRNNSAHLSGVAVPGAVPNSACLAFC